MLIPHGHHCLKNFLHDGNIKVFPYPDLVFNAFNLTPLDEVKVIIIGQDPYLNNEMEDNMIVPQAMGLSFSVPVGIKIPSSLKNIYKNLKKFGHIKTLPKHGNIESWAWQGVLLLNRALTVQAGHAKSHISGWSHFTQKAVEYISSNCDHVVFLLWGSPAQSVEECIDTTKHNVIKSSHPSGLSANSICQGTPPFNNVDHFGKTNEYLISIGQDPIHWNTILL